MPAPCKRLSRPGLQTKEKSGTTFVFNASKFPKSIALLHFFNALYLHDFHGSQNKQKLFFYTAVRYPSLQRVKVCFRSGRKSKLK